MLVAVLTTALPAGAQEQATVLKRDGSRVSGRFEAWNRNNNSLYLRASQGDQRIIPVGEAAMFEVGGDGTNLPAAEIEAARSGDHVLVLRSGDVIRGRLLNIEGGEGSGNEDEPRMLSFKPNDGAERRARFSEVRRLYFGNFPASLSTTTSTEQAGQGTPEPALARRVLPGLRRGLRRALAGALRRDQRRLPRGGARRRLGRLGDAAALRRGDRP